MLQLFDKIKEDGRHSRVGLLSHGDIPERVFGPFAMAYENFSRNGHKTEFLGLLISSFIEARDRALDPDPTPKRFWTTTKKLLDPKFRSELVRSEN